LSARGRGSLEAVVEFLARVSHRWVPDAFSIALLLTLVTFVLGLLVGGATPSQCLAAWGGSLWTLLPFSMQIALVIFLGYLLAVSPPMKRWLDQLAALPRTPRQAIAFTAFTSMVLCWLNWGVGLIASAVLVKSVGRRHPSADYRLLVAAAYLGLGATWHGGPSGSVPLLLATPGSFMVTDGLIAAPIPLAETIFTLHNLVLMTGIALVLTLLVASLQPSADRVVTADRHVLDALESFEPPERPARPLPAERLMHGRALSAGLGLLGAAYVAAEAAAGRFSLTLDSVNLVVLCLALLLHPSAASLGKAAEEAARPLHGVVLQFPLYAGIYGIIKETGLASALARLFLEVATPHTFPWIVFVYSAILNYLVPSGGAKWAMEAPYLLEASRGLGIPVTEVAMAYAYGDMSTNLIQPFWAIPLLGVARLEFRDILGFEILMLAAYTILVTAALFL